MRVGIGRAALAATAATLALAGGAQAATVGFVEHPDDGSLLLYAGAPGEENDVRVTTHGEDYESARVVFEERGAPLAPGTGCTELAPGRVECGYVGLPFVTLGDRDDRFVLAQHAPNTGLSFSVEGGAGDDELRGHDTAIDLLHGGADDDVVVGGRDDEPVRLPEICIPACDERGPHDVLEGGDGEDTVRGGPLPDTVMGGPGDDVLHGGTGDDEIFGSRWDVETDAPGSGDDLLDGGAGVDRLYAGDGNDRLRTSDRAPDGADCGDGDDALSADARDTSAGCERVRVCGTGGRLGALVPGALDCVEGLREG
jgi:hypothetical protein